MWGFNAGVVMGMLLMLGIMWALVRIKLHLLKRKLERLSKILPGSDWSQIMRFLSDDAERTFIEIIEARGRKGG